MREKPMGKMVVLVMALLVLFPVFTVAPPVQAADDDIFWGTGGGSKDSVRAELGLGNKDPRATIATIINVALSFLGIIAVVIILMGGFKWMTAGGSEDKVSEAKHMITAGVIGLVIILASWSIATFVLSQLYIATNT